MSTDIATDTDTEKQMDLQVKSTEKGACERHYVVTIPRAEIDTQFKSEFDKIAPQAEMPGFRVGKAPRKLLESRFRPQVTDQVKSTLVLEALRQITEAGDISAISEPDMDYGAVELPKAGDFTFEFTIEVRPEFDTPDWKGLSLEKPVFNLTDKIVDQQMTRTLARFSEGEGVDGEAQLEDRLVLNGTFKHNGNEINELEETSVILRDVLSFADCEILDFGNLMTGVKEGESRSCKVTISSASGNEALRGQEVEAIFEVDSIFRLDPNEVSDSLLSAFGFESADQVRDFVRIELERQQEFQQLQSMRKQITDLLLKDQNWDMPETLVDRQTNRELQRRVLEMRRNKSSEEDIRIAVNALRRNAKENTIASLREHFVLEKIAEELGLEPSAEDYESEIDAIAQQQESSTRRVRANLERTGQMDALRNQIIERRVIEQVIEAANVSDKEDSSFLKELSKEFAIDVYVAPRESSVPVAKYDERAADENKESSTVKLER